MFDQFKKASDTIFNYFEERFKEKVYIATIYEDEEIALDLIIGESTNTIHGAFLIHTYEPDSNLPQAESKKPVDEEPSLENEVEVEGEDQREIDEDVEEWVEEEYHFYRISPRRLDPIGYTYDEFEDLESPFEDNEIKLTVELFVEPREEYLDEFEEEDDGTFEFEPYEVEFSDILITLSSDPEKPIILRAEEFLDEDDEEEV